MLEDLIPIVGIIAPFAMVVAVVVTPIWLRSRDQREMQQTLRVAIDKGQPLPPELIDKLTAQPSRGPSSAHTDLRKGVVWLAAGLGVAAFGAILGFEEQEALHPILGLAAIPALIGVAFIVLSFFNPNKGDRKTA